MATIERLDFTFINNTLTKNTFELFNGLNSFAYVTNKEYITALLSYRPFSTYPPPLDAVKMKGAVIFDQYGDLYVLDDANGDIACQIHCETYPYRSLLESMKTTKILIRKIRIATSSNQNQLIMPIQRIERTPLTNQVNKEFYPVTISPLVVQPLLNEFVKDIPIDGNSGLTYVVYNNEVVNWTIEFEFQ